MAEKRVLVTGGTGFVGRALVSLLVGRGFSIEVMTRQKELPSGLSDLRGVSRFEASVDQQLPPLVINLAGEGIADRRWSTSRRQVLLDSRVGLTNDLYQLYSEKKSRVDRVISASAVGFYGFEGGRGSVDECSDKGQGFAADLCSLWEQSADQFKSLGAQVCRVRIGVVLGDGGMLARLKPAFKMGLGGRIGSGQQVMSWITLQDLLSVFVWLLDRESLPEVVNATSPNPTTNVELTKALGRDWSRPTLLPMPSVVVKALFGQMGEELLLGGQSVRPDFLMKNGFSWQSSTIEEALKHIVGSNHK